VKIMKNRLLAAFGVIIFSALILLPTVTSAQNSGQGLEISPPLLDLKADPGQTLSTKVQIRNVTKGALITKAQFEDFLASGEDGQPRILLGEGEKSPYSIKDWLQAPSDVRLEAGERKAIDVTINVPKDASPGGHYGVVRFTGTPPEVENSGVSLSASVGTLMLLNISGDAKQSARVAELYTSRNGKRGSLFEYGPLGITTRVENDGNVHFQPKGTLLITDTFGRTVSVAQFNQENRNILPGSIRKFENNFDKKFLFGKYTVQADIVYGSDNQITSAKTTFWVIPYKVIGLIILGLALLIFIGRGYNKLIISRANKKNKDATTKKDSNKKKS
jgi:hypothetical protein